MGVSKVNFDWPQRVDSFFRFASNIIIGSVLIRRKPVSILFPALSFVNTGFAHVGIRSY